MTSVFQQLVLPSLPSSSTWPQENGKYAASISVNEPLLTSKYLGRGSQSLSTPMTRNSRSSQVMVLPTLLAPPKAFWFISLLRTTTGSGPASALASQAPPYRKGTSNMGKKSAVVMRVEMYSGSMPLSARLTMPPALNMMTLRSGMLDSYSARASRYVSIVGASDLSYCSYGCSGSQLSIEAANRMLLRSPAGLFAAAR